jgi:hypothetical protein
MAQAVSRPALQHGSLHCANASILVHKTAALLIVGLFVFILRAGNI